LVNKQTLIHWHELGIKNASEIPTNLIENETLRNVVNAKSSSTPYIQLSKLKEVLNTIKEPLAAMDMEICSSAIPFLQGTKPFQQIPFLFCIKSPEESFDILVDYKNDDRKIFAEQLIKLTAKFKSILVYDKSMEIQMINALILLFPDLKVELKNVAEKIVDVSLIFKNFYYYHSGFKNNFSLKSIATVLVPEISYGTIQSGLQAMNNFEKMMACENEIEKEILKADLIDYCYKDTIAVLEVYNFLLKKAQ
jgi:hypothetical protein